MTHQLYDSKLWKAITAVASGIMTSLLYDLISYTSYVIQAVDEDGTQYILTPNDSSTEKNIITFLCILLVFFILWTIFTVAIQVATKISKQLTFKKMKHITSKNLTVLFSKAREQTLEIKDIFYNDQGTISNINIAKLQLRELAAIISSLHAHFIPKNQHRKKHMKDNFRHPNHSTIININNGISKYEFLTLIDLLNNMVNNMKLYSGNDELMNLDCTEMSDMLNDLKTLADMIE